MSESVHSNEEPAATMPTVSSATDSTFDVPQAAAPRYRQPSVREESKESYVQMSQVPRQENGSRPARPVSFPDVSAPTTNGIENAPRAPRNHRDTRSQGASPQGPTTGTQAQATIQERRSRPRHRSHGRGRRDAPMSPLAEPFVPLAIPVTQTNQARSNYAQSNQSQSNYTQSNQTNGYTPGHPPYMMGYPTYPAMYPNYPQPNQFPTNNNNHQYGPQQYPVQPPQQQQNGAHPFYTQPHHVGPTPPPHNGLYQGPPRGPTPFPSQQPYGPPPPAPRPAHAQVVPPAHPPQPPPREMSEEEVRLERIRAHRQQMERARGFDEEDDDEFIPGI
ncbi:uncharacterized protein GGS22DRAFT_190821 [Annulohypoxylon maeteangense]|uniref:uncharacterized protein n=1 Tax=Annulohypoxylon maeteangense TaxID=1927788 RepID=UPI0020088017|nr:uncharacterized protein GGS22DRAFT_190821 [Annulohypoxylon maeteangense]KAI0882843.1 hypothetical protein GGS22DRAFT_190821 [Annulohypoxylon maeteangense]